MATQKDDFIYAESAIDAEIEALENKGFDFGEMSVINPTQKLIDRADYPVKMT